MNSRPIAAALIIVAIWDFFAVFRGIGYYFDLPSNPNLNAAQFGFGLVVTALVFGFVIATKYIWSLKGDDIPILVLKSAWVVCVGINLVAAYEGTSRYVFSGDEQDGMRTVGLAVVTALVVSATIFMSFLLSREPWRPRDTGASEETGS